MEAQKSYLTRAVCCQWGAPCIYIFFMQLWVRVDRQVFVWVKGRQELLRLVSFQTPSSPGRSRSHKCWIRRTGSGNETSTSCPRASRCQGSFGHCTCMHVGCSLFDIVCVGHWDLLLIFGLYPVKVLNLRICVLWGQNFLIPINFCLFTLAGAARWRRLLSSGSGVATEPVATQWNSPTVDDIHVAASHPVATGMNTGWGINLTKHEWWGPPQPPTPSEA